MAVVSLVAVPTNPSTGQNVTVSVSIRNQGTVAVSPGNNFYLDVYSNRVPQPRQPGDLVWGVQGGDLGAGQTRTFTAQIPFNAAGDYWLYAQVDTDQTVGEMNEENNRLGGCDEHRVTVTGVSVQGLGEGEGVVESTAVFTPEAPRATPTPLFEIEEVEPVEPIEENGKIDEETLEEVETEEVEIEVVPLTPSPTLPIIPSPPTDN